MEFDIKAIDFDADGYDVRKALELVLHGLRPIRPE
jgi:hypothetical protein